MLLWQQGRLSPLAPEQDQYVKNMLKGLISDLRGDFEFIAARRAITFIIFCPHRFCRGRS